MKVKKILVVDDEKLICWSLNQTFTKSGHLVVAAMSGEEGLKSFQEFRPDIVLLDINLPDANGLEMLKQIKQVNEDTVVIMITANLIIPINSAPGYFPILNMRDKH